MNGAQGIIDTILENARDDAAHTLAQARDKAKKLHDAAEEGAKNRLDAALERAESDAAQRRERSLRMEQLELRKAVLGQQRELIDQAFQGALEQLVNMDEDKKRQLHLRSILASAEGGEALHPAKDELALYTPAFLAGINQALEKAGKKPLTLAKALETIRGGLVLESDGVEQNLSYEALLRGVRDSLEPEVARVLFEET